MKVISKQKNSKMCYICGMENDNGLKAQFYNMEDGSVMTKFMYRKEHQSFPGRVHGGLLAAMLDELACRAYWVNDETTLGATMSMDVKYRNPVPYDTEIIGKGIITTNLSKFFTAEVRLMDKNYNTYTNAVVKYIKLPAEKICCDTNFHDEMNYYIPDNVTEI